MIVCIIGIVLAGIVLADNGICSQIQEQPGIPSDDLFNETKQVVMPDDVPDDQPGPDSQAAAPGNVTVDI
ncbi:hypothetical protein SDC9_118697 [bioreactor metagenome]|uniref:Uncharacterized protein n=1 Tax=bioreactor metagenome TaxID=1076179 RepID=A0A645C3E3_9ZZZZ